MYDNVSLQVLYASHIRDMDMFHLYHCTFYVAYIKLQNEKDRRKEKERERGKERKSDRQRKRGKDRIRLIREREMVRGTGKIERGRLADGKGEKEKGR